ncbi:glycoside hydrolase family 95 protein [Cohnella hashimotonis]|uniref:Glycoside hydrolase family 95 protein n=1 Tax=Cohnella hashimotonis TaxID=2826895 RepID=A0ABT6THY3_9BACL|nr:glycoside hydrolase family 95 protein [Cohnella hashimotonis]MDI4646446.1 glycoside hydrolase family 95 protein [Cohnella hashimotonis]
MSDTKLWYDKGADGWKQGLPLGNGKMGAVIYGDAAREVWSLTEATYWSGKPEETPFAPRNKADLEALRNVFWSGDYAAGEDRAAALLQSEKGNFGTNMPMCDLILTFTDAIGGGVTRELDLETALYGFACEDQAGIRREALASHADGVIAGRLTSVRSGGVSFALALEGRTERFASTTDVAAGILAFAGRATETMHSDGQCGVRAEGRVQVVARGGQITAVGGRLVVEEADEAWIFVAASTDYDRVGEDWRTEGAASVERAIAKGYDKVREDHISDYRRLFGRVEVSLGDRREAMRLPTGERMSRLREGAADPGLFALFFQYGRYLTIAGSREDSALPLHLQGIWNDGEANRMAWSCDYHLDINTEMNYFPTEAANLAECHLPLLRYVERLADAGRRTARDFYAAPGWVAHVFSNAWGFTAPGWHYSWGLNVTGGLWLAEQLRVHYEYGLDDDFLRRSAYPVLKEAALFFLDYMSVHPEKGWLVTGPSNSPENSFFVGDGRERSYALSMGATLDQVLVRDLFAFCLSSADRLGTDEDLQVRLREALSLLPPLQIGAGGQLQEWLEDYGEAQPDHRHVSHLHALFPGAQVTPHDTPELAEAAKRTLANRMDAADLEDVEFTLALFAGGFARLGEGELALRQLSYLIGRLCFDNLLTYSKAGIAGAESNIFVADGNFGGAAAFAEMLMQSHGGAIHLLPALPASWHTGSIRGLRARGNAEVDLVWSDGALTSATIRAGSALQAALRYGGREIRLNLRAGETVVLDAGLLASTAH